MPTRKDYPIPDCPNCGKRDSRVLNTYYSEPDGNSIIRWSECNFCAHRLYTEQPGEMALDPEVYRVIIPKFTDSKRKRVEVRHKSKDTHYRERQAARANDQQQPTRWNRITRTKCNLPGAEDIEASNNRMIALNWLYRLSGEPTASTPASGLNTKPS